MRLILSIIFTFLLMCSVAYADELISEQTQDTTPASTDLLLYEKADNSDFLYSTLQEAFTAILGASYDTSAEFDTLFAAKLSLTGGTITGNVDFDDGTTHSPLLKFTDATNEVVNLYKNDTGSFWIYMDTGNVEMIQVQNVGAGTMGMDVDGPVDILGTLDVTGATTLGTATITTSLQAPNLLQGNTDFGVVDSGTGQLDFTADGEDQAQMKDGTFSFINGMSVRVLTTTSGHKYCLGAYDVDGTAWIDVLCFENANTPKMELQAGAEFSGLGASSLPVAIGGTDADGRSLTAAEMNQAWLSSGAGDWVLPDECDSATGYWVSVKATAAHLVSLDLTDAADQFVLSDGTEVAAANELDTAGASGNMVTVVCMAANKWYVTGEIGTCADGGESD